MKDTTNNILLLPLFNYLLLYIIRGKTDAQETPPDIREEKQSRTSYSRDDGNISHGE